MNTEPFDLDQPPGDRIACRLDDELLTIGIRKGGNYLTRNLGIIVLSATVLSAAITSVVLPDAWGPDGFIFDPAMIVCLSALWIFILGLLRYWIVVRFMTTILQIEPDRLEIENELFLISNRRSYRIPMYGKAKLTADCNLDGLQIDSVTMVVDTDRRPRFGTFLTAEEKQWLVGRINLYLGAKERPAEIIGEQKEEPRYTISSEPEIRFFDD